MFSTSFCKPALSNIVIRMNNVLLMLMMLISFLIHISPTTQNSNVTTENRNMCHPIYGKSETGQPLKTLLDRSTALSAIMIQIAVTKTNHPCSENDNSLKFNTLLLKTSLKFITSV